MAQRVLAGKFYVSVIKSFRAASMNTHCINVCLSVPGHMPYNIKTLFIIVISQQNLIQVEIAGVVSPDLEEVSVCTSQYSSNRVN